MWRKISENDLWLSEKFTRGQAWVDLIMLANHKPGILRKRGIRVDIERGQLGWSEVRLAERWKWSRGKVRRFLSELASGKEPFIVQQKSKITTLITIINYSTYQSDDTTSSTTDSTTNGHQTDIKQYSNKNGKNGKNEKKEPFVETSEEVRLSELLLEKIIKEQPTHSFSHTPPKIQKWAETIDLMFRINKRTPKQVEYIINWLYSDDNLGDSYSFKVQSMSGLREKFDRIVAEIKKKQGPASMSKQDRAFKGSIDTIKKFAEGDDDI